MDIQKITINGSEISIPGYYQRVKSLPSDPVNSIAFALETEHASCLALIRPISEKEALPRDKMSLIDGTRRSLQYNQGIIQIEAEETFGFSIVKTLMKPNGVFYKLVFERYKGPSILEVQAQFQEKGTTGIRESMVYEYCRSKGIIGNDRDPFAGWTKDPYDANVKPGAVRNYSEREMFDQSFPDFPLSLCRSFINTIVMDS